MFPIFTIGCSMYSKKFFLLALITIVSFSCFAQTKTIVGLKPAIDSALHNYPELKSKQYQVASAAASVTDAENQVLPSLTISDQVDLGTDNGLGGSYFPMSIIPSTSGGIRAENMPTRSPAISVSRIFSTSSIISD